MAPVTRRTALDSPARRLLPRAARWSAFATLLAFRTPAAEIDPFPTPSQVDPAPDPPADEPGARASPAATDWRTSVTLDAAASCATLEDLERGIERRAPRLQLVDDPDAPRRVEATIRRTGGRRPFTAALVIERPEESPLQRTIRAESCAEALEALAFMTAVALDPREAAPAPPTPLVEEPPVEEPPAVREEPLPARSRWTPFLGAGVHVAWAVAPSPLLGPELMGGFESENDSFLSPMLRLTATRAARQGFQQPGGTAHFTLMTASFELCPFRVGNPRLSLRPCGFVTAGMVRAEGTETVDAQRVWRPWWVPGGSLVVVWQPWSPIRLAVSGRFGRPLVRDIYEFEPEAFHQVPGWAASGGVGLEVQLP